MKKLLLLIITLMFITSTLVYCKEIVIKIKRTGNVAAFQIGKEGETGNVAGAVYNADAPAGTDTMALTVAPEGQEKQLTDASQLPFEGTDEEKRNAAGAAITGVVSNEKVAEVTGGDAPADGGVATAQFFTKSGTTLDAFASTKFPGFSEVNIQLNSNIKELKTEGLSVTIDGHPLSMSKVHWDATTPDGSQVDYYYNHTDNNSNHFIIIINGDIFTIYFIKDSESEFDVSLLISENKDTIRIKTPVVDMNKPAFNITTTSKSFGTNAPTAQTANINWVSIPGMKEYRVERSFNSGSSWSTISTVSSNFIEDTNLIYENFYGSKEVSYKVIAISEDNSEYSSDVQSINVEFPDNTFPKIIAVDKENYFLQLKFKQVSKINYYNIYVSVNNEPFKLYTLWGDFVDPTFVNFPFAELSETYPGENVNVSFQVVAVDKDNNYTEGNKSISFKPISVSVPTNFGITDPQLEITETGAAKLTWTYNDTNTFPTSTPTSTPPNYYFIVQKFIDAPSSYKSVGIIRPTTTSLIDPNFKNDFNGNPLSSGTHEIKYVFQPVLNSHNLYNLKKEVITSITID